jgi:fructose/tagatose bisphosphate aldolase
MEEFKEILKDTVKITDLNTIEIIDQSKLRDEKIDKLIYLALFSDSSKVRSYGKRLIMKLAERCGLIPSSIQPFYEARAKGEISSNFTVPAINIRGLTYDVARAVWQAALKLKVGALIFEIARSEIGYTDQRPAEYAASVMAAGIKEGAKGPIFLQGDHFQVNRKQYQKNPSEEINTIKALVQEAIEANFFNIDIDASTLVDLTKEDLKEQQRLNYELQGELTQFIRNIQPKDVTISIGGEIGEVGGKNSTIEDLDAFMEGYQKILEQKKIKGISKISIQTGTTHGGIPLPDGSIAKVKLDFETLEKLGKRAKTKYRLAGVVQHGASTLPDELFDRFPKTETLEIHLATGFQNMIYDHPKFPPDLKDKIYHYIIEKHSKERKEGETQAQFIYKTRKRAFGPFKKELWNLLPEVRIPIREELKNKFEFLFKKLKVQDTQEIVCKYSVKQG